MSDCRIECGCEACAELNARIAARSARQEMDIRVKSRSAELELGFRTAEMIERLREVMDGLPSARLRLKCLQYMHQHLEAVSEQEWNDANDAAMDEWFTEFRHTRLRDVPEPQTDVDESDWDRVRDIPNRPRRRRRPRRRLNPTQAQDPPTPRPYEE